MKLVVKTVQKCIAESDQTQALTLRFVDRGSDTTREYRVEMIGVRHEHRQRSPWSVYRENPTAEKDSRRDVFPVTRVLRVVDTISILKLGSA